MPACQKSNQVKIAWMRIYLLFASFEVKQFLLMSYFDSNDVIPKYYFATDVIYIYL